MCEILAPVGNKENLISAINAGADAVYLGLTDFSARKSAENFDIQGLKYAVAYAKTFGVKVYLTVNTLIKESELNSFISAVNSAYSCGVDAFILQDVFMGKYLKEIMPDITLHLSTQAGVCNEYGAKLAKRYGFSRVILARETKLEDIKKISQIIETEVFIQGALCTSFSGHCYFSSFIGANSGNRGYCKQPCRKEYLYKVNGKTVKKGYLLSLSDLSVATDIITLKNLGVSSFKIEGRMRGKEYVSSAILYYKSLLNGKNDENLFNNLKISFNRGDYTKGLAFSQDKNLISDKVQNNIGLEVGKIKSVYRDTINFDSNIKFSVGDAFKILRNGVEVGNATVVSINKTLIKYSGNPKIGDTVRLTKKIDLYNNLNIKNRLKEITVSVNLAVGSKLKLSACGVLVESEIETTKSINSPITKNEVITNLNKTDIYPYKISVQFENFSENAFVPKSVFNKLRAELYRKIFFEKNYKTPYFIVNYVNNYNFKSSCDKVKKAVIVSDVNDNLHNYNEVVYAPYDYSNLTTKNVNNLWLYLPPYLSSSDINLIKDKITNFKGIYSDGVWAIELCNELSVKLFAGVGFNVFNSLNVKYLLNEGVNLDNICASKELSLSEVSNVNNGLYVLSNGLIEIMDLIYCPFNKYCKNCEIIKDFELVDSSGRVFPVKRYKLSDCRFKIYNMAKIKSVNGFSTITDLTVKKDLTNTQGNLIKGVK